MAHDFNKFPELANSQMEFYYWESPHKQITEDFRANVMKVVDGDTIRVTMSERDFDFPVRFLDINAPELSEGGRDTKYWLKSLIEGQDIDIRINLNQRVGKWGRLLGHIIFRGVDIGQEMMNSGRATPFDSRNEGKILEVEAWL